MSLAQELPTRDALAHERFELWAHSTPNATALRFCERTLSYGELNVQANQLAHHLRARGVGAEDRVVVCVEPGFEIIVALLAILKLGAVYVPLDPSYPRARIQAMLEDTQPRVVVTHSELQSCLPVGQPEVLPLDRGLPLAELPEHDLNVSVDPSQTAYVYYTSGTTGTPKGVMASHANLTSYLGSARRRYGFDVGDVGVAIARFTFSISMFELLSPLSSGGSLLLLQRAHVLDAARLSETLRFVTFFHAGPSLLRGVLDYIKRHHGDFAAFDGVRHASSGGDTVPPELLEDLRAIFRKAEVFVIYGCSEISCMGTTYEVPRSGRLERTYVGRPFDGTTLRVVADDLGQVPVGTVGEVLFAGPGVVRGYLNRPQLTAEKFLEKDGLRFYRTGDRGKLDQQGLLELVGRSDFQVKLGGIRIELGEIEHHLRRAPQVANGVVSAVDRDGEKALVAYVVLRPDSTGDSTSRALAIRRYLAEQLPDYMVPRSFVELAALPLNHNLKVDRRALPEPPRAAPRPASASAPRPPRSATEQRLAALWCAVLGLDRVGLDDNFFELGGTSLLALRLIQEVERELVVTLTGLEVLREPLEAQAQLCAQRSGQAPHQQATISPRGQVDQLELFHFGPDRSLYGVLHGSYPTDAQAAVLLCAPLGHEALRAHFVLQRLARSLAAAGTPVLRFDYYGCLDSRGESSEASCARWQRDIIAAREELMRRTGARHVTGIGVRLGATLLANIAQNAQFSKLVLWDPVEQGSAHLADLRAAHRRLVRASPLLSLRSRWVARTKRAPVELLGSSYSPAALRELAALALPSDLGRSCPVEQLTTDVAWLDLSKLEDMLPDVGTSRQLGELALRQAP
jgi:amino acid adenylation domain-containing protein